jgi:hypothetical protein
MRRLLDVGRSFLPGHQRAARAEPDVKFWRDHVNNEFMGPVKKLCGPRMLERPDARLPAIDGLTIFNDKHRNRLVELGQTLANLEDAIQNGGC